MEARIAEFAGPGEGGTTPKVARRPQVGRWSGCLAGAAVLALFVAGCSQDPPDTVASMQGYRISATELQQEMNRRGPGTFERASVADREAYATTLLDKEILLRLAKRDCPTPRYRELRQSHITAEKRLVDGYLADRQRRFALSEDAMQARLALVRRTGIARGFTLVSRDRAKDVVEALRAGADFETVAKQHGARTNPAAPAGASGMEIRLGKELPLLIAGTLLRDQKAGTISDPIETNRGVYVVKMLRYDPFDLNSLPGGEAKARDILNTLAYIPANARYVDSLKTSAGIAFHSENDHVVNERFSAYWDSLNQRNEQYADVDYRALKAPVWRFTPEERALPLYDLGGKTHTIEEFVRSLDDCDLDVWPTIALDQPEACTFKIQGRVMRILNKGEAIKAGIDKSPAFLTAMKHWDDNALLDQWRQTAVLPRMQPTEAEEQAEYRAHPELYASTDQVQFGVLIYPPGQDARAAATLAKLRNGDPLLWYELGPAEAKAVPGTQFVADSPQPVTAKGEGLPDPAWDPFLRAALQLETGQISEVVRPTNFGPSLVRATQRQRSQLMPFTEARTKIQTNVASAKADAEIDRLVKEARQRWKTKVYADRLSAAKA